MKKGLLILSTLLFLSCVNLNELTGMNDTKNIETKTNVLNSQKNNKKKNISNSVKVAKTKKLLKEAEAITEDTYANKIKKYKAYKSLTAYNPNYKAKLSSRINVLLNKIEKTYNFNISGADLEFQNILIMIYIIILKIKFLHILLIIQI